MKPHLTALLLALALLLAACGGQAPTPTTEPAAPTDTAAAPTSTSPANTPTTEPTAAPTTAPTAAPTDTFDQPANSPLAKPTGTIALVETRPVLSTDQPPASPTPANGTDEIVFVFDGDLATVNVDDSNWDILFHPRDVSQPRPSPDGSLIAFVRGSGSDATISIISTVGRFAKIPHVAGSGESDPRWSPDGATLAFVRAPDKNGDGLLDDQDAPEIWLMNADGSNPRRLTDGFDPAWSPDGKRIAFATAGDKNGNTIDMINSQGQNRWSPIKIAAIPQDTSVLNPDAQFNASTNFLRYPAWSPDGSTIAFVASGHSGLIVTASDKGANITLRDFNYEGGYGHVVWSPDGKKLAYEAFPASGINQVQVLDLGSKRSSIWGSPQTGVSAESPTWAPDSTRLAFIQRSEATTGGALVIADAKGGDPKVIVPLVSSDPYWR